MSTATLVGHLILGLTVVFGLMAVLAKLVRRGRGGMLRGGRRGPTIETVARLSLSKAASVAVLRVGERELLVGVGSGSVSVLAETSAGVLTGVVPRTIDVRDGAAAGALLTAPATPLLAATITADSPEPVVGPVGTRTASPKIPVGQAWWPTFVELLRQRTVRTTRAHRP